MMLSREYARMPRLMNCTRLSVSTRISQSPVPAATICSNSCEARSCFLGARLLADVDGHADDAHHLAGGVTYHAGRIEQRDVVAVAMADAVLERDHGFGAAVEPLLEQRLIIGMHQRRPVGRRAAVPRWNSRARVRTPSPRGQAGLRVDLVDHAAQFARHGPEALVGGGEPGLADLALGDVDDEAEHPAGRAVGRTVHDIGAIERPVPAAIGVAKAIFGLEHLRRGIHVQQPLAESLDLAVRVGAEQLRARS